MRRRTVILGGGALVALGTGTGTIGTSLAAGAPVVLELFTSQGCSSCPPADALLGELVRRPGVIGLAWHVDYWNRLGWPDPFASREWTERQRAYARRLRTEVYTPALVANGAVMVVGSDRRAVETAMRDAPPLVVPASLRREGGRLQAMFGTLPAGASLSLAVYDPEHVTAIRAGENGGRRLREFRIVRSLRALAPVDGGLALPAITPTQGAVLLIHDAQDRLIGAAEALAA
jgi:hypothetical protein